MQKKISQPIRNKVMNLNDTGKQTLSLPGKPKVKRIFQKIDFKTLQESGFDRQIAKVIYRKNVNLSKSPSSATAPVAEITIPDKNAQFTYSVSEILNSLEASSVTASTSVLCHDSHEAQSQIENQNVQGGADVAASTSAVDEPSVQVKAGLINKKLVTKNVKIPKLHTHLKPASDEYPTNSINCEKVSSIKGDSMDKSSGNVVLEKSKLEAAKNKLIKNQIDIPKASIKSSGSCMVGEAISQKMASRKKSTTNPIQKSNTKHLIVLENKISSDNDVMKLASIKSTKIHEIGETVSQKVSRRRSSINPVRNSAPKSLIVLENKILSENEMIDLTSLRLPNTNRVSSSVPLTKPLDEILKKKTMESENVATKNTKMEANMDEYKDKQLTNTINETNENVRGIVKEPQIVEIVKGGEVSYEVLQATLDFTDTESKTSKTAAPVELMSCSPPPNMLAFENTINAVQESSIKSTLSDEFIAAIPGQTGFEHSKSAVEILNEPKISDTFSAVDFLASINTIDDINQISPVAVSFEELNLCASFGENFSPAEIGKLKCPKTKGVIQTNLAVEIDETVRVEPQHIVSFVDDDNENHNGKMDNTIIISDVNESETTNLIENVKNCPALSSTLIVNESKVNEQFENGRQILIDESSQSMKVGRNNSPTNSSIVEVFDEDNFASLHNMVGDQKREGGDNLDARKLSSNIEANELLLEKPLDIEDIKKSLIDSPTIPSTSTIQNKVKTDIEHFTINKINDDEIKPNPEVTVITKVNEVHLQSSTNNDGRIQNYMDNESFKVIDPSIQNDNIKKSIEKLETGGRLKSSKMGNEKVSKKGRKVKKDEEIEEIVKKMPKNFHQNEIDNVLREESTSTNCNKIHKQQSEKLTSKDRTSVIVSSVTPSETMYDQILDKVQQNVKQPKEEKEPNKSLKSSGKETNEKVKRRNKIAEKKITDNLNQGVDADCKLHKVSAETTKRKKSLEKLEKIARNFNNTEETEHNTIAYGKTDNSMEGGMLDAPFEESNKNQKKEKLLKKVGINKGGKSLKRILKKQNNFNDSVEKCTGLKDTSVLDEVREVKSEKLFNNDDDLEFISIKNEIKSHPKRLHNVNVSSPPSSANQSSLYFKNSPDDDYDDDSMEFLGFEDHDQSISEKSEMNIHTPGNAKDNKVKKDATLKSWLINIDPNQDKRKYEESMFNNLNVPLKKRRDLSSRTMEANKSPSAVVNYPTPVEQSKNRKKRRKKSEPLIEQTEIKETLPENFCKIDAPQTCPNDTTPTSKKKGRIRKEEINFNPRLLLITKREQLDTDVKLTDDFATTVNKGSQSNNKAKIQCGLCLKYINSSDLWISHLSEHYGIGWKVGDSPLNLTCRSSVLNHMITYYKETQIKGLSCRMCQKIYRSALGLLMHIEICGLPPEKVECDLCKRMYTKISLANHRRSCPAAVRSNTDDDVAGVNGDSIREGEQQYQIVEQLNKVIGNTGRIKRVSTIKAETKLKKINAHLTNVGTEENITSLINYVTCNLKNYVTKWQEDLSVFGKAFCPQKTCKFYSVKQIELEDHVKSCRYIQQPGYYCKLCNTSCFDSVDLVTQHIQEKHQDKSKSPSDNSDCDVNTDDEDSTDDGDHDLDNVDDNDIENDDNDDVGTKKLRSRQSKKSKKSKSVATTISTRNNDSSMTVTLKGKKGFCIRYSITEKTLLHKWRNFLKFNYSDVPLYTKYFVEYLTKESNDANKCLPKQLYSMKFAISENLNFCNDADKGKTIKSSVLKWLQLKRFETLQNNNDEIFLFCGAPVKALYWLPLPNDINEQYLAVICRKDMNYYSRLSEPKQLKSTLLIFKVKQSNSGAMTYPQVQLHYAVYIENGPIHDVSFLPSGGYNEPTNRLALMAVANISDVIKIYALPINLNNTKESSCNGNDNGVALLELKTTFQLQVNIQDIKDNTNGQHHSSKAQCLKISWSETIGHKHIFAGFSNGFLGIWDITDNQEDNLNRFVLDNKIIFVPINYWYVGEDCIKHLQVHYDTNGPRWLAVIGKYRRYIVYDIRDFMQPIIVKCEGQSSIICTIDWPLMFETFLLGVCDCIAYNGRCLFAVNPIGGNFSHNKLDNMLSGVVNVHYTPYMNIYVCGMANGDIILLHSKKLPMEWPERKNVTMQRVFSTMDVKSLLDGEINGGNNNDDVDDDDDVTMTLVSSLSDDFQMFDPLYKEKYGLIFGGKLFTLGASQQQVYLNEKRRPPHCFLPYKRISSVRCNLNIQGKQLIAFGYDNGFIRVIHFDEKHYFK